MTCRRNTSAKYTAHIEQLEPRRLLVVAFPGAEGAGANALGGRGGDVFHVNTLVDTSSGSGKYGSLRYGINSAPASGRTIVFDVAGTIQLNSTLDISKPKITIAGQTAPGDGITLAGRMVRIVNTNNVILRHIRIRVGDVVTRTIDPEYEPDALWVANSSNVMVDHVSTSWSIDETLSVTHGSNNVTVQWSFITESLRNGGHSKGAHGYGSLINGGAISYHHNLYAHHDSRNPRPGSWEGGTLDFDFRNNVVYNWGGDPGYNGSEVGVVNMNYVGNYFVAGPSTSASKVGLAFKTGTTPTYIYQSGNKIDPNRNKIRDGTNTGWGMFTGPYIAQATEFPYAAVTTQSADDAYNSVLGGAGARPWSRDGFDSRMVYDVKKETGGLIDSQTQVDNWPVLNTAPAPTDTDGDGMPDAWESANGLNPAVADNNGDINGNGYTNLEDYINSIIPIADTTPPSVTGKSFSFDAPDLSPMSVEFTLNESVAMSLDNADLQVHNVGSGEFVPTANVAAKMRFHRNIASFTFPGYASGILPDGNYVATLLPSGISDDAGNPLGAGDSVPFFVLAADANRDRKVDTADFNILAGNFGQSGKTFSQGNFNYAGNVDSTDFNILVNQYGKTLAPAAAPGAILSAIPLFSTASVASDDWFSDHVSPTD